MNTYRIQLLGPVDIDEINALSPHEMTILEAADGATLLSISTDQSGMIGLLRHLNNLGLIVCAVECQSEGQPSDSERMLT